MCAWQDTMETVDVKMLTCEIILCCVWLHHTHIHLQLTVQPINSFDGEIELPGSKSISNRILLLSALSGGSTIVDNLLQSEVRMIYRTLPALLD